MPLTTFSPLHLTQHFPLCLDSKTDSVLLPRKSMILRHFRRKWFKLLCRVGFKVNFPNATFFNSKYFLGRVNCRVNAFNNK